MPNFSMAKMREDQRAAADFHFFSVCPEAAFGQTPSEQLEVQTQWS